jgi:anaerobic ribonucleoside-triphosphate reductase activating protein
MNAQIAQIVNCTQAEGPGKRLAIWFQGCPLRCRNCCNPEMLPFDGGTSVPIPEICDVITAAISSDQIEGITLLGGEPFAHAEAGAKLAKHAQSLGLSVMAFSGFTLKELQAGAELLQQSAADITNLLDNTDLLVDGPYLKDQPDHNRRWIGSTNQSIHFLTERYSAADAYWKQPNTLEIRMHGNELSVNGFPAQQAINFWRRSEKN